MKYLLATLLVLTGCSLFHHANRSIRPVELVPYIESFEEYSNMSITVDFYFVDLEDNYIGKCYQREFYQYILVDKSWWDSASDLSKEQLIFHELGHCVLLKKHNTNKLPDWCPESIMNPYHIGNYCYGKYRDYYLEELFGPQIAL